MMNNINNMFQMARNPKGAVNNMISQQFQNNPLFQRAQQMAQGKSEPELQQIAQNLCKQRGINMEEAMAQFNKSQNKMQ